MRRPELIASYVVGSTLGLGSGPSSDNIAQGSIIFRCEGHYSPDGAVTDGERCLWSAQWGGGKVVRFAPSETSIAKSECPPVNQPAQISGDQNENSEFKQRQAGSGHICIMVCDKRGEPPCFHDAFHRTP